MNSMNHSNFHNSDNLFPILNELKNKANLDGIIYAYRDGRVITDIIGTEFNSKKFSSMCASVLESAVEIGETIGNQKINKVIAELGEKSILIFECDNNTFLVMAINRESEISYILSIVSDIIQKIIKMY
jgi:predicted regulator of Ras-like GTPase activity (Roadblock/LC7/MglB family)